MSNFGSSANPQARMDQTHKEIVDPNPGEMGQYKKAISTLGSQNLQP